MSLMDPISSLLSLVKPSIYRLSRSIPFPCPIWYPPLCKIGRSLRVISLFTAYIQAKS
uniref:Uncharacterized protein n=1 Tax=Utricularia reniformis TaxID=192314 RepID=A0A1Y0B2I9_9LAMI|nr:hypothetical protein AEK19_MT1416 [Utricularia reniformis]ART31610.1 hypothetical protein AEK19_MT1416 [Utricularia reniformis]